MCESVCDGCCCWTQTLLLWQWHHAFHHAPLFFSLACLQMLLLALALALCVCVCVLHECCSVCMLRDDTMVISLSFTLFFSQPLATLWDTNAPALISLLPSPFSLSLPPSLLLSPSITCTRAAAAVVFVVLCVLVFGGETDCAGRWTVRRVTETQSRGE